MLLRLSATTPAIPSPAAAAGFNTNLFFDDFDTLDTVDLAAAHTGKNWYIDNGHFWTAYVGATNGDADPSWFSVANSILTVSTNVNSRGAEVESFYYTGPGSPKYTTQVPLIDGSMGFYIEGRCKFARPATNSFMPGFWMQDINQTIAQIETTGTARHPEIDIFEGQSANMFQSYVEWDAWNNNSFYRSGGDLSALDMTAFHRWGARVRTMAQNGGTGTLDWYVDDVSQGTPLTWTNSANFGGAIEAGMFQINFSADLNLPLNIDHIGVWQ